MAFPMNANDIIERITGRLFRLNEPLMARCKNVIRRHLYQLLINQREPGYPPPSSPIRAVFLVNYPAMWPSLQSIFERMSADACFDPIIVTLPTHAHGTVELGSNESNFQYFSQYGNQVQRGFDESTGCWLDLRSIKPDLAFVITPYDAYPEYHSRSLSHQTRLCYVPYGIMSAKIQDNQFNRPFHYRCWRIFCETQIHKELFAKYSSVDQRKIVVSGYPKLDWYRNDRRIEGDRLWPVTIGKPMKRVVWAPHWSIPLRGARKHWLNFSTFHRNHLYFLEAMKNTQSSINWLFKPHPALASRVVRSGLMSNFEFQCYMDEMLSLPNVIQCRESEYLDYFATSDALITCSVSFLSEYLPTGKPILRLDNPDNVRFNEFGDRLIEHLYRAQSVAEIDAFLQTVVLNGHDPLLEARLQTLREVLYFPKHHIGGWIKDYLKVELEAAQGSMEAAAGGSFC